MSYFPIEPLQNSAKGWRCWTMKTGNTKIQVTSTQEGLRSRRVCFDTRPTCFREGFNRFTQIHFILGEKSSNVGLSYTWSPSWAPYMFVSPSWAGKTKLGVKLSFELLQKVAVPKVSENTLRRTVTLLFEDLVKSLGSHYDPPIQLPCSTKAHQRFEHPSSPLLRNGYKTLQKHRGLHRSGFRSTERRNSSVEDPHNVVPALIVKTVAHVLFYRFEFELRYRFLSPFKAIQTYRLPYLRYPLSGCHSMFWCLSRHFGG